MVIKDHMLVVQPNNLRKLLGIVRRHPGESLKVPPANFEEWS